MFGSVHLVNFNPKFLLDVEGARSRMVHDLKALDVHKPKQQTYTPRLSVGSTVTLTELCKKGKHKGTIQEVKWQVVAYVTLSNRRHLHLKCLDNPHRADQFVALSRIEKELR